MTETEGFAAAGLSAESAKALGFSLPMGRIGKPDDIAKVALFLASDQSGWVTGERISVSGGQREPPGGRGSLATHRGVNRANARVEQPLTEGVEHGQSEQPRI